jgi:hypothetical protein
VTASTASTGAAFSAAANIPLKTCTSAGSALAAYERPPHPAESQSHIAHHPMLKFRTAAEKIYAAYTRHPRWVRLTLCGLTAEISKDADAQTER